MSTQSYPREEEEHIWHISGQLSNLAGYVASFQSAVSLFRFCQIFDPALTKDWSFVAARDGAMSIYHVAKTMEGIRSAFRGCPTFRANVDHSKLRAAEKDLKASFPGFESLRHAIAHNAELRASVDDMKKNSTRGPFDNFGLKIERDGQLAVGNGLSGDTFFTSIDGIMASYEVSVSSCQSLQRVKSTFESGFISA